MASRNGEPSRSSANNPCSFGVSPVATRRDYGSSGGSRPAQATESANFADSGWQVVDARNGRSGRSWAKLFKQLNKLLDDMYLSCELDCSLTQVQTLVQYLEASAADFAELHSQLESVVSPSGQKVAWEVRTFRRASNRSPRMGAGPFGLGGADSGGSCVRLQGPFGSAFSAAASSAAAGASRGSGSWASTVAAWPPAAITSGGSGGGGGHGGGPATARSASRTASGGGAPMVGVLAAAGAGPGPGNAGALPSGMAAGGDGGASAGGANPWKGRVNWSELFTAQQQQQRQQHKLQQRGGERMGPGGNSTQRASVGGATAGDELCVGGDGAGGLAAGSGDEGSAAVFRLGSAPPPPLLRTASNRSGRASASGEGSLSPPTGAPSPLDALYHKMLSSPSRKMSPSEVRRASEERQARAEKARQAMVEERLAKLAQANQSRQTAKSIMEERAGAMAAQLDSKIARSAELRQAHLAERVQKAVEETKKVAEVAFINQMLEQDKKLALQEKLEEGETRRRQALEALQQRGKGAAAAVEEAQERRKLLEAERREQLADRQRRKLAAQAKLEEERRAAAAAREAASRAQRAAAAQAAEARERLRDVLSVRIEERLREAAARRAQHLELIKERAALGKDLYERRTVDGFTTSPRSPQTRYTRPPSPEVPSAGAGGQQLPPPPPPLGHRPAAPTQQAGTAQDPSATGPPPDAGGPAAPSAAPLVAAAGPQGEPLRSTDRSITLSGDPKRRLKGMRRRACKTLARLEARRPEYLEPPHLQALLDCPDGRELIAAWAALVADAGLGHSAAAYTVTAATVPAAAPGDGAANTITASVAPISSGLAAAPAAQGGAISRQASSGGASGVPPAGAGQVAGPCTSGGGGGSDAGQALPAASRAASRSSGGGAGASSPPQAVAAAAAGTVGAGGSATQSAPVTAAAAAAAVKHLLQRVHTDLGGRSKGIAIHAARPSGLLIALTELLTAPAAAATSHPPQTSVQLMELLALLVTSSPHNAAWLLARCDAGALAGLVRCGMRALDRYNGLAADEVWEEPPEARYLAALLQTLACLCRTPFLEHPSLHAQQEELVAYVVACGLIHRSTELFSLFDQPAANDTAPIPGYVLQCLALLEAITGGPGRRAPAAALTSQKRWQPAAANGAAIALAFQETSMAGLPSLLTAVLLRAAPSCTPAEARPERLPPNFVEAAACVMRVLNNIARLDLVAAQTSLGASDLRVVFFHLVGFLLSYCTNQWPTGRAVEPAIRAALAAAATATASSTAGPSSPAASCPAPAPGLGPSSMRSSGGGAPGRGSPGQPGPPPAPPAATGLVQLLNEVLLLIGYYGLLQPANQDVLLWGKSPTLLQRLAEVPFPYFVEQQLYQVLMPTLVAVCYGSDRACATMSQHMDLYLLRNYVQTMMRQGHHHQPGADTTVEQPGAVTPLKDAQHPAQGQGEPPGGNASGAFTAPLPSLAPDGRPGDPAESGCFLAGPPESPARSPLDGSPVPSGASRGKVPPAGTCDHAASSGGEDEGAATTAVPAAAATGWDGSTRCSHGLTPTGSTAMNAVATATADAALEPLPTPTAERYSLPQRFPPELLPQVLAFLERQMPGASERGAEASLAAAVAAAAAAGRLGAAASALPLAPLPPPPPQMSSTPFLAVMPTEQAERVGRKAGNGKKAAGNGAAATAAAMPDRPQPGGPESGTAAATADGSARSQQASLSGAGEANERSPTSRGQGSRSSSPSLAPSRSTSLATPPSRAGSSAATGQSALSARSTADSVSLTVGGNSGAGGGGGGCGSAMSRAGSSGSTSHSHSYSHHFRRYLDAGDVPVPFSAGGSMGVRRNRLFDVAAMVAMAGVGAGAGAGPSGEGSAGGGGGGSADGSRMDCARSYVSELSFGGFLTPSLQGDSAEADSRSPGEDERLLLDELDLEQYEQQRLDEQQHLDEQYVLLLDAPVEGAAGGQRRRDRSGARAVAAEVAAAAVIATGAGEEPVRAERGEDEGAFPDDEMDLAAGLRRTRKTTSREHAEHTVKTGDLSQASDDDIPVSSSLVMDAWWRQLEQQLDGAESSDASFDG